MGSFRSRKSANFLGVPVRTSQISKFFMINTQIANPQLFKVFQSANHKSANFHETSWQYWIKRKKTLSMPVPKNSVSKQSQKLFLFYANYSPNLHNYKWLGRPASIFLSPRTLIWIVQMRRTVFSWFCLKIECALSRSLRGRVTRRFGGFFYWIDELSSKSA